MRSYLVYLTLNYIFSVLIEHITHDCVFFESGAGNGIHGTSLVSTVATNISIGISPRSFLLLLLFV
jgi:hypothetical protein